MAGKKPFDLKFLRIAALISVFVGAVGSLLFMFDVGRNQDSVLLLALFTAWVLSPFTGLFVAAMVSRSWQALPRISLYCLMIILTPASLAAYGGTFSSPDTKPAFVFLVVPLVSWFLGVTVILITGRMSRRSNDEQ